MAREHTGTNRERSEYYGALQDVVDALFAQYGDLDPLSPRPSAPRCAGSMWWWLPRRPTCLTSFCASSRCSRLATTRASACAPS